MQTNRYNLQNKQSWQWLFDAHHKCPLPKAWQCVCQTHPNLATKYPKIKTHMLSYPNNTDSLNEQEI